MHTRRYPRSSRLAFTQHTDYACAIERPARSWRLGDLGHRAVPWAALACLLLLVVIITMETTS